MVSTIHLLRSGLAELIPHRRPARVDLFKGAAFPVQVVDDLNAPETIESMRKLSPEIIVFGGTPQILSADWGQTASRYLLNVHPSPLPDQRGSCPIWWSIVDEAPEMGVTIHRLDPGVDDGPILLRLAEPLQRDWTGGQLLDWILETIPLAVDEALQLVRAGDENLIPQGDAMARTRRWPRQVHRRIDWQNDTTATILKKVRAGTAPYPLRPSFFLRGRPFEIGRAEALSPTPYLTNDLTPQPGTVMAWSLDSIDVATRDGIVRLSGLTLFGWKVRCDRIVLAPGQLAD